MDLKLKGLKAIVSGGTKGIGRAIVETLAQEGVQVAFCARHAEEVAQAAAEMKARGFTVWGHVVDVGDGPALGAGMQLAMFCDIRVATSRSTFGIPAAKLGLAIDHATVVRLAAAIARAAASDDFAEGRLAFAEKRRPIFRGR